MKLTPSETLMRLSLKSLAISLLAFLFVGLFQALTSIRGIISNPTALSWALMAILVSFMGIGVSLCLSWASKRAHIKRMRSIRHQTIPILPMDKEPGWNKAVLGWFHRGPELREPDQDFKDGFAARSQVPPPTKRRR